MIVTKDLIKKIALQSRLNVSDEQVEGFLPQLREILETFAKLDEVDVKNANPSFHPVEVKNVSREDEVGGCLSQEDALSLTLHKKNGYFRGPRAL